MSSPAFSFLVLSDIHFGTLAEHKDFALDGTQLGGHAAYAVSMKQSLIDTVKASGLKINAILVPGDLTSTACPNEFAACWSIIEEFADALSVERTQIFFTYGNHDCNWRISQLADGDVRFKPDEHFKRISSSVGDYFCKNHSPFLIRGPLPGSGVFRSHELELFIANSGYFCLHDQELKHGKLGADQLKWLSDELGKTPLGEQWRILMLHHHSYNYPYPSPVYDLSFLEEGDILVDLLGKSRVDFVCHGHRHHPILKTRMESGWASPVNFLCAGSVAVNANQRANGHIPNLFHLVTLERRHTNSRGALGNVRTFRFTIPNGWIQNDYSQTVPLAGLQHFGSVASESERRDHMAAILATEFTASSERFVHLPHWNSLPDDLRYSPVEDTKLALVEAANAVNAEIFRTYPDRPLIIKTQ